MRVATSTSTSTSTRRGHLLLDAMVAMGVFGVVLGGWASLTAAKFRAVGEADRRFRAVQAAQSAIAEARDGARAPGRFDIAGGLRGELKAERGADGLVEVTVTVEWMEPGGVEESIRLSTLAPARR